MKFKLKTDDFASIKQFIHSGEATSLKLMFNVVKFRWMWVAKIEMKTDFK